MYIFSICVMTWSLAKDMLLEMTGRKYAKRKQEKIPRVRFSPRLCILFHFKIKNNQKLYSWPVANNFFISTILRFYQSGYIPYIKGLGHQMDWAFVDMTLWLEL
jgi:hypothetical protein